MLPFTCVVVLILNTNYFITEVLSVNVGIGSKKGVIESFKEIRKCCPANQVILMDYDTFGVSCEDYDTKDLLFTILDVYDKSNHEKKIKKPFSDIFRVAPNKNVDKTKINVSYIIIEYVLQPYLSEDGILYLEYPNAYERWIPVNSSNYCVDYELMEDRNVSANFKFLCDLGDPPKGVNMFFTVALCVSSAFLVLVLIVYLLLPGLRNLGGMKIMAYVFSLLFAFIHLVPAWRTRSGCMHQTKTSAYNLRHTIMTSFQLLTNISKSVCISRRLFIAERVRATTTYFFFLASFCWMNVMSYDIWWTFRGYAKARAINRRGETFKFLMYCIYGFGVPLAMSIAFVVVNGMSLSDMPWIVKPLVPDQGCFIEGGQKLLYLYVPMLILIICNWIFFLMTAFNIWRLHRATAVLDSTAAGNPAAHRSQQQRFFIYLKLSIIMGVNWILEVVSSVTPDFQFWFITDAYNLLIGLAIFLIFCCKKKIYEQLKNRYDWIFLPNRIKAQPSLANSSQDTPLQVYSHPNGTNTAKSH